MDITVYLPDELGQRAKAAEPKLNLSQLLREAVIEALDRRAAISSALEGAKVHELMLEDDDGRSYIGRITGAWIAGDPAGVTVYLTDDERVILHDEDKMRYWVVEDPVEELRDLEPGVYAEALNALGEKPVVDL